MPQQIPNEMKKQRTARLMTLSRELHQEYLKTFMHHEVEVLWEREENGYIVGHSSEYLEVCAPYDAGKLHRMETVCIIGIQDERLIGKAQEVRG